MASTAVLLASAPAYTLRYSDGATSDTTDLNATHIIGGSTSTVDANYISGGDTPEPTPESETTITFTNGVASWSDTASAYTAKWVDANGNGAVDSADTVAITATPLNAANEMKATVTLTVAGASDSDTATTGTYTLVATDTKTVSVYAGAEASGTAVDATALGYTFRDFM